MLRAVRKNRVVRIPDEKAETYKKLGYGLTDMNGHVLYEPEDSGKKAVTLEAENAELKARIAELAARLEAADECAGADDERIVSLEAENAELKARVAELEAAGKKASGRKAASAEAKDGAGK